MNLFVVLQKVRLERVSYYYCYYVTSVAWFNFWIKINFTVTYFFMMAFIKRWLNVFTLSLLFSLSSHTHTHTFIQGGEWERVDPEGSDPHRDVTQWSSVWRQTDAAEWWVFFVTHTHTDINFCHTHTHTHGRLKTHAALRQTAGWRPALYHLPVFSPACFSLLLFGSSSLTQSLSSPLLTSPHPSSPHLTGAEDTNSLLVLLCVCDDRGRPDDDDDEV